MTPNRRVLVVEDDPGLRDFYSDVLEIGPGDRVIDDKLDVTLVESGVMAVASVEDAIRRGEPFCGGFFDLVLPGELDGIETMRRIRELDPHLFFCVVSGAETSILDTIDPIFEGSAQDWEFLAKPAGVEEIYRRALGMSARWNHRQIVEQQGERHNVLAGLGMLAAGLAHEINGPLGFVHDNLTTLKRYGERIREAMALYDQLEEALSDGRPVTDLLTQIHGFRRQKKMDFILDDLSDAIEQSIDGSSLVRDISKAMKALSPTDRVMSEAADVADCCRRALLLGSHEIRNEIDVVTSIQELPPVRCNGAELTQILLNLLVNAAHAIEGHGKIRVRTYGMNDRIVIEVEDNGCGISADRIERIFEPFFTTRASRGGSGMGLMLVRDLVEKYDGQVEVESTVGEGTLMRVELPTVAEEDRG
ncbi:MAG: ATP-binding protein [Acidobacteriota bacterium]|nr:ATP-binding protein [Acidobacteriota bacterium]